MKLFGSFFFLTGSIEELLLLKITGQKITQDDSGEEHGFKVLSGYLFIGTVCKNDSVSTFTKK